ncbi:MAG: hypothetical protein LAO56_02295 [Acidobacteriia bacterium]|nr:hypothetical protein [Terriglobia bacterium]
MSLYPESIARCQHLKVNGTQCGSPALHHHKFCYFHKQWRQKRLVINSNLQRERGQVTLPVLEDADSIQMGLVEVMRLLVTQQIDHKTAGLLLYALQTASANLKRTSFEPELPTRVVIDRGCVGRRPIGATAWSVVEGREYDDLAATDNCEKREELTDRMLLEELGFGHCLPTKLGERDTGKNDESGGEGEFVEH